VSTIQSPIPTKEVELKPSVRRRVGWSLVTAMIAEVINKASPLVVLYFAQVRLQVTAFGQTQYALVAAETLIPFVAFGYNGLASLELGERSKDSRYGGGLISNVLCLKAIHLVFVLALWALFVSSTPGKAPWALDSAAAILLLASCCDTDFVHYGSQTVAARNLFTVAAKILGAAGVVLFVRDPSDMVIYAAFAAFPALAVSCLSGAYNLRLFPLRRPNFVEMKALSRRAIPYGLFGFIFAFADRFDVLIVGHLLGPSMTGIYSGQMRLVQSVTTAASSIGMIFYAEMVSCNDRPMFTRHAHLSLWAILTLVAPIVGGIWFVDRSVLTLMYGPSFSNYSLVLDLLTMAALLQVFVLVLGNQVLVIRRQVTRYNKIMMFAVACGALVAWQLSARWGITGVAIGNLTAKTITVGLFFIAARPFLESFPWAILMRTLSPAAIMALALALAGLENLWANIALGGLVFGLAFLIINKAPLRELLGKPSRRPSNGPESR